jgi:hypothetical protein
VSVSPKDPARVAAGHSGARKRWGPPRILRLDTLTPQQRRLVLALLDAAKADESEQAA